MISEFDIIGRYFTRPARSAVLGVGDDCALLRPRPDRLLAISTDTMLEGRHFFPGADPFKLGHKALAVNLSDLAAMGADPGFALLALTLPEANEAFLEYFSRGFLGIAERFEVELIGGDTTRGPLAITVTVIGEVPPDFALRRDGALAGDDIWISGSTGEAALALANLEGRVQLSAAARAACEKRLHAPDPRVELGGRLRGIARSAIDISDGLLADLSHILEASGVGAELWLDKLPRSSAIASCANTGIAQECLLAGGDDYELLFSAPPFKRAEIDEVSGDLELALTRVGIMVPGEAKLALRDARGEPVPLPRKGYDHFA